MSASLMSPRSLPLRPAWTGRWREPNFGFSDSLVDFMICSELNSRPGNYCSELTTWNPAALFLCDMKAPLLLLAGALSLSQTAAWSPQCLPLSTAGSRKPNLSINSQKVAQPLGLSMGMERRSAFASIFGAAAVLLISPEESLAKSSTDLQKEVASLEKEVCLCSGNCVTDMSLARSFLYLLDHTP